MTAKERGELCKAIRARILQTVSQNGGHLSSSLGAVELIVAMHAVFEAGDDPFIFDVSHQAYAHKLLTDRWERFESLRSFGGICGFTKPSESEYDYFVAGHSSTSISVAVGAAKAIALKKQNRVPVVLIGDGSMSAGMVYEAMNELGDRKYPMVIIINDNEMSIAKPIGAISRYLSRTMAGPWYQRLKNQVEKLVEGNEAARYLAKRFEESLRLITPGVLFEELGLEYIGPVDGHDLEDMIAILQRAKAMGKPVVVHAQTLKGKGYQMAEGTHEHWHGVGPFDPDSGKPLKNGGEKSATAIYSEALLELARQDEKIVGVTAAMPSGTGLDKLMNEFPERFWDVAIAEQHAVTSCAALAKEGFKPFCTLYSTFLQRGFDQVIHDVAIGNLPVVFALDRAGIVGEDGETHQGTFDVAYLRLIPNLVLFAPRDEATLRDAVRFAAGLGKPCAFRYPRGNFYPHAATPFVPFELGRAQWLKTGGDLLLIGYGNGVAKALAVHALLEARAQPCGVLDLRFVKPLDQEALRQAAAYGRWAVLSDSSKAGGVSSALLEALSELGISGVTIESFELPDAFLPHGTTALIEESLGLSVEQIASRLAR
ncbi:MAG: 1-deoxy-D-xylulose-5-phosphate synthase [Campylobacterales bacterium]